MATKKDIDKDHMYKKLMPTNTRTESSEKSLYYSDQSDSPTPPSVSASQPEQLASPENQLIYNPVAHKTFVGEEQAQNIVADNEESAIVSTDKEIIVADTEQKNNIDDVKTEQTNDTHSETASVILEQTEPIIEEVTDPITPNEAFVVINLRLELVNELLVTAYKKYKCCDCERCRKDILSATLNSLSPIYDVVRVGEPTREPTVQERTETASALVKAMLLVRTKPNHD